MRPASLDFTSSSSDAMSRFGHWVSETAKGAARAVSEKPALAVAPVVGAVMALALGAASAFALRLPPEMSAADTSPEQAAAIGELPSIETAARNAAGNPAAPPVVPEASPPSTELQASLATEEAQGGELDRQIAQDMAAARAEADEDRSPPPARAEVPSFAVSPAQPAAPAGDSDDTGT